MAIVAATKKNALSVEINDEGGALSTIVLSGYSSDGSIYIKIVDHNDPNTFWEYTRTDNDTIIMPTGYTTVELLSMFKSLDGFNVEASVS